MSEQSDERIFDLLCEQAVYGLPGAQQSELESLMADSDEAIDLESLQMTVAAISLTAVDPNERMPDHLKSNILAAADRFFDEQRSDARPERPLVIPSNAVPARNSIFGWLGWAVAAAACVALFANVWISRSRGPEFAGTATTVPTPEDLTPAQKRERFLASLPPAQVVKAEWGAGNMKDLTIVGDIVWSDSKQEGYMRFRNLPKNDAGVSTYQLWIFDETQSEKTPIDGGTFDVNQDGEVVVPIHAKLAARNPKAFAITIEKPGGVVVSKREKIPALAPVKPNQV